MTFAAKEESRQLAQPVELYYFQYGEQSTSFYAYTDHDEPITVGGIEYVPYPISSGNKRSSGTLDKSKMPVKVPRNMPLRDLFNIYPPSYVISLTIRQGHVNDPDEEYLVSWSGRVLGFERKGSQGELTCEPISTSMRQIGLREFYQVDCPHYLYGPKCRASRAAATSNATVASTNGFKVTLDAGWNPSPLNKYLQGEARWTNSFGETEIRQILKTESPDTLTLAGRLTDLLPGTTMQIALGCNHQTSALGVGDGDCVNLHNNGPNFGGCKFIPLENPVGTTSGFY